MSRLPTGKAEYKPPNTPTQIDVLVSDYDSFRQMLMADSYGRTQGVKYACKSVAYNIRN